MQAFLIVLGVIAIVLLLASCGGGASNASPSFPPPSVFRSDLYYCYYGSLEYQLRETVDHVNLFMAAAWGGPAEQLSELIAATNAGIPTMVALDDITYLDNSEQLIRERFASFQQAGVLSNIVAVYPKDEPKFSSEVVVATNTMIRKVMAEFGMTAKVAVIYVADSNTWPGIESFDWVGFDRYDVGDKIFTNGDFAMLKSRLTPQQKIILVPGGASIWKNDPTQFFNKAQADSQIILIMPFVWFDPPVPDPQSLTAGIRSNGMAPIYKSIGEKIKNPPK